MQVCGDRELWVLHGMGPKNQKWGIPIYVDPFKAEVHQQEVKYFRITPAIALPPALDVAMKARMMAFAVRTERDYTMLQEKDLNVIATKAPGITPSFYLQWPTGEVAPQATSEMAVECVSEHPDMSPIADRFLTYVFTQTQVVPLATLKLVWKAITQCAFTWMSEKKEPLNIGFATLFPVPYRVNWHQIMKAMFPSSTVACTNRSRKERNGRLDNMGFIDQLRNSVNTALDPRSGVIRWRIELAHDKQWWRAIQAIELQKLELGGMIGYTRYVGKEIQKRTKLMVELFTAWTKEAVYPCGHVDDRRVFSEPVLKPWLPPGRITPWRPPEGDIEAVVSGDVEGLTGPENESSMAIEATKRLLQVSDL